MNLVLLKSLLIDPQSPNTLPKGAPPVLTPEQIMNKAKKDRENKLNILGCVDKDGKILEGEALNESLTSIGDYIAKYTENEALGQLLLGDDFKLDPKSLKASLDKEIKDNFKKANQKYKYFDFENADIDSNRDFALYKTCYKLCHYSSHVLGDGLPGLGGEEIGERAYKIMVFCGSDESTLKKMDALITKH